MLFIVKTTTTKNTFQLWDDRLAVQWELEENWEREKQQRIAKEVEMKSYDKMVAKINDDITL